MAVILYRFVGWAVAQQQCLIKYNGWVLAQPTKIFKIFACLSVLMFISCAYKLPHAVTANDVAQCKIICKQHIESCQKTCRNNCMQCNEYAASRTANSYRRYVHEQCVRGGLIIRQLNSYHDPLQCAKTTCNCSADYQVCKQSCSGFIHKQLLAPPLSR